MKPTAPDDGVQSNSEVEPNSTVLDLSSGAAEQDTEAVAPIAQKNIVRKRLKAKHPLAIRWFHWINFPVLMVMIWSGLLIYWANDVYRIGWGETTLFKFFPPKFYEKLRIVLPDGNGSDGFHGRLAEGMAWHFWMMWIFALNGLGYVLYTAISGEWRHLLPTKSTFKEAIQVVLHDLHLRREPLPRRKFNGAQQIAYTSVVVMGFGSLVTGLAIYKPVQFGWITWLVGGYGTARFIHFWLTIGYCVFFLVHVAQVVRAGWNNFRAMITGVEVVTEIVPVESGEAAA
jgi:thiosulfate reductase cytochrome b subunit